MKSAMFGALMLCSAGIVFSAGAMANDLPVPPVPPTDVPAAEAAPVPNENAQEPAPLASEAPSVDVKLYRAKTYSDSSAGFAPGSRYQTSEDRKAIQTPGLSISVPLR